jgi:hypothetical protein
LNRRHEDFQSSALPTELSRRLYRRTQSQVLKHANNIIEIRQELSSADHLAFGPTSNPLNSNQRDSAVNVSLSQRLSYQRIEHILASYQLWGDEPVAFQQRLQGWLDQFPPPLIELALVETLIEYWLRVPLLRGLAFLDAAERHLIRWQQQPIVSTITPQEFERVSGLDPRPIFGVGAAPASVTAE